MGGCNMREELQKGLRREEAAKRLEQYGPNRLKSEKKAGAAKIFAAQFKDVLVLILLASTVISVAMGEYVEAITIIAIVFLNAVVGFIQEYRTEKTLEALKKMAAPTAKVIRDGAAVDVPAEEVVPGDVVLLKSGMRVCADGFVLESAELAADESLLTGES
ncbi:MAG: ATPase, partial [Oscillospiraceae bacterium]|nr:ATPase [Oscillospiraceae bacterium]